MTTLNIKLKVQNFGRFLSNMVMPNIGAFIAWGFITAIFIPTGWYPNENVAKLVGPMITYLLPLLIGYSGGKLVHGERGGVVAAVTTMGVVVGASIPMFLGAMIVGPLSGWVIKQFDKTIDGKIKSGFEMLVNNFSAGIIGMLLALLSFFAIGPSVVVASKVLASGVDFMVQHNLLPLTSIIVEPAKILFLNNAINHGIFSPLGIQQAAEHTQSIFFLIEANPGPGLGLLLAYMLFGKGAAKGSASGAAIIHFFGGIHEIYFPYVLMNPRLIIAMILGGMTGVFTLTLFNSGLSSPASPGSIIALLAVTPKDSMLGVITSVLAATTVSFLVSIVLLKTTKNIDKSFEDAKSDVIAMKDEYKALKTETFNLDNVKKIVVACDAGMGSSAMGAGVLRKKIQDANLDICVINLAINNLTSDTDIVITHRDLTQRAKQYAPNAHHISLTNFLNSDLYSQLVNELIVAQGVSNINRSNIETSTHNIQPLFQFTEKDIFLGLTAQNKEEAIRFAGQKLMDNGYVKSAYIEAMLERERLTSTYLGQSIAVPHGTIEAKDSVINTGIVFCQYPAGIEFGEEANDKAKIVIGIAARNNEHLDVIAKLTNALDDPNLIAKLSNTSRFDEVLAILS
ncbi:PTS mannitol transporter subunit IICBA [Gilliamella sp. B2776]|uniref:PTS mannitol transporter subunit IICBA n=1 Tax=unclassified Gilliamella TaxID=2685620 RepID=UPI002269EC10|nr:MULTISPECIES: PTS mannitol transporter subunit IICBA [unclassified Gilliamella]MCX8648976.1 PTS mannitol transporter subunit IICBA [Gilliamella sp. B2779]MCX8653148.1 PTS mannitol transporter subunit IICBA [Gilliamella sp. B2737]MCX8664173.1 PTS mannitol transporter subunit IICBA [Gilliamella sp. B2887]MCX8690788.1 PTS mannitol transporter subunit IICBA [Gilliamella sp. B2776]MCX8698675.1 PTS mannitol transporter subunit IICBA [Gilliamella sp. B3000]